MKKSVKLMLIGSVIAFNINTVIAKVTYENEKNSCYLFNANKLIKKGTCIANGITTSDENGDFQKLTFKLKGYNKITLQNTGLNDKGKLINAKYRLMINGNEAIRQYRDPSSLRLFSDDEANNIIKTWGDKLNAQGLQVVGEHPFIQCYKQKNAGLELCYFQNTLADVVAIIDSVILDENQENKN